MIIKKKDCLYVENVAFDLVEFSIIKNKIFLKTERIFLEDFVSETKINILFNRELKISEKQLNFLCRIFSKNKEFIVSKMNYDRDQFEEMIKNKNTKLKIYQVNRTRVVDLIGENLIGFYFPNQKYLISEIKKIKNSRFDRELNLWILKITSENYTKIKNFIRKNNFLIGKKLKEKFEFFNNLRTKERDIFVTIENNIVKIKGIKLDPLISRILLKMEVDE